MPGRRILTFVPGDPDVWAAPWPEHGDPGIDDFSLSPHGDSWQITRDHPRVLVCTNGGRDRCCAERGRPLWQSLPHDVGDHVWECTHLGGHRFAPVALAVPSGLALGRVTPRVVADLVLNDEVDLPALRGRSDLAAPEQVGEWAARHHWGLRSAGVHLEVTSHPIASSDRATEVTVEHPGLGSRAFVIEGHDGAAIAASCQGDPAPVVEWRVRT